MASVSHLGLFALPNIPLGTEINFLAGRNRCVQPSSEFNTTLLTEQPVTIAPANLSQSTYTAVSFERAMLWLWRVKTFSVSASLSVTDSNFDETLDISIGPHNIPNRPINFLQNPIESEKDKVCDCGLFYTKVTQSAFEDLELGSYEITVGIAERQNMWANYPTTPEFKVGQIGQRIRANVSTNEWYIPVLVEVRVRGGDSTFGYNSGDASTALGGTTNSPSWQINDLLGSVSRPFSFGSIQNPADGVVNIDAIEYWPYDPEDGGGPIYDSATGAQLRDFP
jgi:hypothetical protein